MNNNTNTAAANTIDLLSRSLQVVESHAVTVAKGFLAPLAANDMDHLAVLESVKTAIG
jgi:hypothetical protein